MKFGDPTLPERIWRKLRRTPDGCWLWMGQINRCGYGRVYYQGRVVVVHRVLFGPLPAGLELDHLCRVRNCANPLHLEAVTRQENVRRGTTGIVNRSKTHCPAGHEYTQENTYVSTKNPRSGRQCRACDRRRKKDSSYSRHTG